MACEAMRGCGYRKVGGLYLVGNGATVGGNVVNDCRFVRLEPIPFPKEAPNPGRGFLYVGGETILNGQPPGEWGISPQRAEVLKLSWEAWGRSYEERRGVGVCGGVTDLAEIQARLGALEWDEGSASQWPGQTLALTHVIDDLREKHGDCPLVGGIMEIRRLFWMGPIRSAPANTLASLWRLVTALSWAGPVPETVLDTVADMMRALGAEADVPLLEPFYIEQEEDYGNKTDL